MVLLTGSCVMGRNQILAIAFCSLAFLGYANTSANAGWFGPSNYNECMVEKMKGQPWNMGEIVAETCTHQFACNDKFTAEYNRCLNIFPNSSYCAGEAMQYCSKS